MKYKYFEKYSFNEDIGRYKSYGICLAEDESVSIKDVSSRKDVVEKIVEMLNKYHASPINFKEIVEDLLIALY